MTMDPAVESAVLDLNRYLIDHGVSYQDSLLGSLVVSVLLLVTMLVRIARRQSAGDAGELASAASSGEQLATTPSAAQSATPSHPNEAISAGLSKTRNQFLGRLKELVGLGRRITAETLESFEELLLTSDLGVKTTQKLLGAVKEELKKGGEIEEDRIRSLLREQLLTILRSEVPTEITPRKRDGKPLVVLVVGVNGVGKTTTIGKLAGKFTSQGARVMLAACDTFRAAAAEQIDVWAERSGAVLVRGADGAKPSTVAYEAIHRSLKEEFDVLIVDTAGRLHTRVNLMNELVAVLKLIEREIPGAPHESILVLDATTGQNALQQAREFHDKVNLSGVVITKLDGTPKGGMVVAVRDELGLPIRYIGVGESAADLRPFDPEEFVGALLGDSGAGFTAEVGKGEVRAVRRRRAENGAAVP